MRHLHLYLDPTLVRDVAAGAGLDPEKAELVEALGVRDPQIEHAAMSLLTELRSEDLGTRIYAESLANVLAVNLLRHHFSRMFKLSTGFSPHQYLKRQRIERAKALLTNTDLPVGVVAREVGFASPSHFAQQFRRLAGVSPRSFR